MGNCLKSPTSDDISLLHESQSDRASYGDGTEADQEPPPPYQEQVPVYHPTPSQTRLATQLTEEEQIRIAQRIGLIQHLPKGVYDPGRDGSEKKIRENGPISDYGYCCCVSALNSLNLKGDYLLILEHHMLSDFVDELNKHKILSEQITVRHLYDGLCLRRPYQISALHAYLPSGLYR